MGGKALDDPSTQAEEDDLQQALMESMTPSCLVAATPPQRATTLQSNEFERFELGNVFVGMVLHGPTRPPTPPLPLPVVQQVTDDELVRAAEEAEELERAIALSLTPHASPTDAQLVRAAEEAEEAEDAGDMAQALALSMTPISLGVLFDDIPTAAAIEADLLFPDMPAPPQESGIWRWRHRPQPDVVSLVTDEQLVRAAERAELEYSFSLKALEKPSWTDEDFLNRWAKWQESNQCYLALYALRCAIERSPPPTEEEEIENARKALAIHRAELKRRGLKLLDAHGDKLSEYHDPRRLPYTGKKT